jgi:hypothetical protein
MTQTTWSILDSGTHKPTGETVKISDLEVVEAAYPTSRCLCGTNDFWASAEYIERMINPNTGKFYDVVYLFDVTDMSDADGEPIAEENYPWAENIVRVFEVK